jgi:hypothetical protein
VTAQNALAESPYSNEVFKDIGIVPAPPVPAVIEMLAPGVAPFWITDAAGAVWTMAPKDPLVEGGLQYVIGRNNVTVGTAMAVCYSGGRIAVRSEPGAVWYQWTDNALLLPRGGSWSALAAAPAGCI